MSAAETEGIFDGCGTQLIGGTKMKEIKKGLSAARILKKEMQLHLMVLPAVILVLIFSYFPLYGLKIAFQRFLPAKGLFGNQRFVGWDNFKYVMALPNFLPVLRNTFFIAGAKIVLNLLVPVTVALMLNELSSNKIKRPIQTIIYFPHFLSWIIFGGILIDLLSPSSGIVNKLITALGGKAVYFLGDNRYFRGTVIVTDVWKNFGYGTIVYLAAITGIDVTLYEAAQIDGANRWQQTWHVTLPGIRMTVVLMMVLALGRVLNAGFDQLYNLCKPIVYDSGDILDTFVYRLGLENGAFGPATAVGLFRSVVSLFFISTAYAVAYKFFDYRLF